MRALSRLLELTSGLAVSATLIGLIPGGPWALELASHFRFQYLASLGVAALILFALRRWRPATIATMFAALNLWIIAPLYGSTPPVAPYAPSAPVRALLLNVNAKNTHYEAVLDVIRRADPDFFVIEEVRKNWIEALAPLKTAYPHRMEIVRRDNYGLLLYSRLPIGDGRVVAISENGAPAIVARLEIGERTLTVLALHPPPPTRPESARRQRAQLGNVARLAREIDGPVLLLGDLNATPWSPVFRDLLRVSKLRDSLRGRGYQGSWPAQFWPLRIPIDHCLHSADVEILDRRTGPEVGSDHLPVIVDFALARG